MANIFNYLSACYSALQTIYGLTFARHRGSLLSNCVNHSNINLTVVGFSVMQPVYICPTLAFLQRNSLRVSQNQTSPTSKGRIVLDIEHEVMINLLPVHSCQMLTSPLTLFSSQKPSGLQFFFFFFWYMLPNCC